MPSVSYQLSGQPVMKSGVKIFKFDFRLETDTIIKTKYGDRE